MHFLDIALGTGNGMSQLRLKRRSSCGQKKLMARFGAFADAIGRIAEPDCSIRGVGDVEEG